MTWILAFWILGIKQAIRVEFKTYEECMKESVRISETQPAMWTCYPKASK